MYTNRAPNNRKQWDGLHNSKNKKQPTKQPLDHKIKIYIPNSAFLPIVGIAYFDT